MRTTVLGKGLRQPLDNCGPEGHASSHRVFQRLYLQKTASGTIPTETSRSKFALLQTEATLAEYSGKPNSSGGGENVQHTRDTR